MREANGDVDGTMKLPAVLDLAAAGEFLSTLRQGLQAGRPLRLDAAGVETLTLPCIQIILSAIRTHDQISIAYPSAAFVSAFEDVAIDWRQGREQPQDQAHEGPGPGQAEDQDAASASDQSQDSALGQDLASDLASGLAQDLVQDGGQDLTPANEHGDQDRGREQVQAQGQVQDRDQHLDQAEEKVHVQDQTDETPMTKRILTIDDSKTMRDMLMLTLVDAGFEVLQGVDGQDGIDVLGDQQVDVVITDINMPKMDGYAVIRHLRRSQIHKTTPILVLTTESDAEKKNLAREAGATGWMVKPFEPDRLVATIRKVSP
jgi:two-component system chemotaxis response regulator CheY